MARLYCRQGPRTLSAPLYGPSMIIYDGGDQVARSFNTAPGCFMPMRQPPGQNPNEALSSSSWLPMGQTQSPNYDQEKMIVNILGSFDEQDLVGLSHVLLDRNLITLDTVAGGELVTPEEQDLFNQLISGCPNPNDAVRSTLPMDLNEASLFTMQGAQTAAAPALHRAASPEDFHTVASGIADAHFTYPVPSGSTCPVTLQLNSSLPVAPAFTPTSSVLPPPPLHAPTAAPLRAVAGGSTTMGAVPKDDLAAALGEVSAEEQHKAGAEDPEVAHLTQNELEQLAKEAISQRELRKAFFDAQVAQQMAAAMAAAAQPRKPSGVFSKTTSPPLAQALEVGPLGSPLAIRAAAAAVPAQPMSITSEVPALQDELASSTSLEANAIAADSIGAPNDDGQSSAAAAEEALATTLILRNLPPHFDQQLTMAWVDEKGFEDAYDFCLWVPAKATSRLNRSMIFSHGYAFVNFRTPAGAKKFRQQAHLSRISPPEGMETDQQQLPVSIALGKVQGFINNYLRFQHLLEGMTPTRCQPFFAQDAVEALTENVIANAARSHETPPAGSAPVPEGPKTTLIIRNLSPTIENQEMAREWLDQNGYARRYDFFLYLPAKRSRRDKQCRNHFAPSHGYGCAFVNFKSPEDANACLTTLNGTTVMEEDPMINVVVARIQGLERCQTHFSFLAESGRSTPWVDQQTPPHLRRNPSQYQ